MGRIIGVDYGERRVGIAVSDDAHHAAFPKCILTNDDLLLDQLARLAAEEQAERFVVGESDNPAGGENTIMRRIAIFGTALEVRTELPVTYENEAYTSVAARRALETRTKTRKQTGIPVDSAAAALILQAYLDRTRQKHASA